MKRVGHTIEKRERQREKEVHMYGLILIDLKRLKNAHPQKTLLTGWTNKATNNHRSPQWTKNSVKIICLYKQNDKVQRKNLRTNLKLIVLLTGDLVR